MVSDDFRADEEVAGWEVLGDGEGVFASVLDESCDRPFAVLITGLGKFDPNVSGAVGGGGCDVD